MQDELSQDANLAEVCWSLKFFSSLYSSTFRFPSRQWHISKISRCFRNSPVFATKEGLELRGTLWNTFKITSTHSCRRYEVVLNIGFEYFAAFAAQLMPTTSLLGNSFLAASRYRLSISTIEPTWFELFLRACQVPSDTSIFVSGRRRGHHAGTLLSYHTAMGMMKNSKTLAHKLTQSASFSELGHG